MLHNGGMWAEAKTIRLSITLPPKTATLVRAMAKSRRLSATRMLVELAENGIDTDMCNQQEFFDLAERFRSATEPEDVKLLGDQMGRMLFGN